MSRAQPSKRAPRKGSETSQEPGRDYALAIAFRRILGSQGSRTPEQEMIAAELTRGYADQAFLFDQTGRTDPYNAAWRDGLHTKAKRLYKLLNDPLPEPVKTTTKRKP